MGAWSVTQVTNNGSSDFDPHVSGGNIAWRGNGDGDYEIYLYD